MKTSLKNPQKMRKTKVILTLRSLLMYRVNFLFYKKQLRLLEIQVTYIV